MKFILSLLVLLYALSPYDLLPDFAIGWGWLDDLIIIGLLIRYLYKARKPHIGNSYYNNSQGSYHSSESDKTRNNSESSVNKNPYTILGVDINASNEEIKTAYRELANRYHPDKVEHLGEEFKQLAESRFKEIQDAYDQLREK